MLRFHIVIIQNNFAQIDLTLFSDVWGVPRKGIGLIFMLFFYLFSNFSNIYTQHTNEIWGVKVEITGKMRFYAILTPSINGKQ